MNVQPYVKVNYQDDIGQFICPITGESSPVVKNPNEVPIGWSAFGHWRISPEAVGRPEEYAIGFAVFYPGQDNCHTYLLDTPKTVQDVTGKKTLLEWLKK